jgi:hypothetical protein
VGAGLAIPPMCSTVYCVSKSAEDDDIVMVPVPRSALGAVYRALGDFLGRPASLVELVQVANNGEWSEADVRQVCLALTSLPAQKTFRCVAAAHGKLVTYEAMANSAGLAVDELRTQLAWFSKRCKRVRGANEWPIELVRDPGKPKGQHCSYRMPPRIAEWWLAAEAERDENAV